VEDAFPLPLPLRSIGDKVKCLLFSLARSRLNEMFYFVFVLALP
jgi:hypothetical protein